MKYKVTVVEPMVYERTVDVVVMAQDKEDAQRKALEKVDEIVARNPNEITWSEPEFIESYQWTADIYEPELVDYNREDVDRMIIENRTLKDFIHSLKNEHIENSSVNKRLLRILTQITGQV